MALEPLDLSRKIHVLVMAYTIKDAYALIGHATFRITHNITYWPSPNIVIEWP